jgi:hypothetical protein
MRLNRRSLLQSMAVGGAALAMPSVVRAQDSFWDMFDRNRVLRNVDQNGNTAAAQALIATNEPILSYDTA